MRVQRLDFWMSKRSIKPTATTFGPHHPHPHCWEEEHGAGGRDSEEEATIAVLLHHHNPWCYVDPDQNSCIQLNSHSHGSRLEEVTPRFNSDVAQTQMHHGREGCRGNRY